eukprot:4621256-Prymnesium_polylepis.1
MDGWAGWAWKQEGTEKFSDEGSVGTAISGHPDILYCWTERLYRRREVIRLPSSTAYPDTRTPGPGSAYYPDIQTSGSLSGERNEKREYRMITRGEH